jgi:hypothetical protein
MLFQALGAFRLPILGVPHFRVDHSASPESNSSWRLHFDA